MASVNAKAAQSLADPTEYENLFPGLRDAFRTEQYLQGERKPIPAEAFPGVMVGVARVKLPIKFVIRCM